EHHLLRRPPRTTPAEDYQEQHQPRTTHTTALAPSSIPSEKDNPLLAHPCLLFADASRGRDNTHCPPLPVASPTIKKNNLHEEPITDHHLHRGQRRSPPYPHPSPPASLPTKNQRLSTCTADHEEEAAHLPSADPDPCFITVE
ncbi:hypothetical protein Dimus_033466, partial [Dionaea muscipula]